MLLVVEVPEEAKAVELVVWISVIQLLEEFQLFQTSLLPVHQKPRNANQTSMKRVRLLMLNASILTLVPLSYYKKVQLT